jgi:membrane protease YdiL (CAAX protease family)
VDTELRTAHEWPGRRRLLLLAVVFEGSLAVLAWAAGWLLGQRPWHEVTWDARHAALGVAATLPLLAGFALCVSLPWRPLVRIRRLADELIRPLFGASTVFDLALISVVAGVAEELLFRGVLQPALGGWLGTWPGLAAASALFGLVHLLTPTYGVLAALVGIYLGWVYLATGNLLPAMIAHGLYDFIALCYVVHGLTDRSSTPPGSAPAAGG